MPKETYPLLLRKKESGGLPRLKNQYQSLPAHRMLHLLLEFGFVGSLTFFILCVKADKFFSQFSRLNFLPLLMIVFSVVLSCVLARYRINDLRRRLILDEDLLQGDVQNRLLTKQLLDVVEECGEIDILLQQALRDIQRALPVAGDDARRCSMV
jgi:hypothetical protein